MMFFFAFIFAIVGFMIFLSDPFVTYRNTLSYVLWCILGALVCAGVGIGMLV